MLGEFVVFHGRDGPARVTLKATYRYCLSTIALSAPVGSTKVRIYQVCGYAATIQKNTAIQERYTRVRNHIERHR